MPSSRPYSAITMDTKKRRKKNNSRAGATTTITTNSTVVLPTKTGGNNINANNISKPTATCNYPFLPNQPVPPLLQTPFFPPSQQMYPGFLPPFPQGRMCFPRNPFPATTAVNAPSRTLTTSAKNPFPATATATSTNQTPTATANAERIAPKKKKTTPKKKTPRNRIQGAVQKTKISFEERFEKLKAFKESFGHFQIHMIKTSSEELKGFEGLKHWTNKIRTENGNRIQLSDEQRKRLIPLGLYWRRKVTIMNECGTKNFSNS